MLTVALVVMVIFLFLRTLSATIIPSVAVPLSLVGTFGVMYLLGYSLNNLTLMALTISTGFVVDDAIVMIENIMRYIEEGDAAARGGAEGLRADRLHDRLADRVADRRADPAAVHGRHRRPAVPRVRRHAQRHDPGLGGRVADADADDVRAAAAPQAASRSRAGSTGRPSASSSRSIAFYGRTLRWVLRHQTATLVVAVATLVLTIVLYVVVPKGFFPVQDTGVILGISEAPQTISFAAMAERQQALAEVILQDPAVESLSSFIGVDGTNTTLNSGRIQINLKPLDERRRQRERRHPPAAAGAGQGRRHHAVHAAGAGPDGRGPRQPHAVPVQPRRCRRAASSATWVPRFVDAAAGAAELRDVASDQQNRGLQTRARDRPRHGVAPRHHAADDRRHALRRVRPAPDLDDVHAAEPVPRGARSRAVVPATHRSDLQDIYVPVADRRRRCRWPPSRASRRPTRPLVVNHQGQFPVGDASRSTSRPARRSARRSRRSTQSSRTSACPPSIQAGFQGTAQAFQASLANEPLLILAALVTVYIVLGVLYESYIHPITILSTLPSAGVGALLALLICRTEFSVIALIGIILLIGIVKKNAIMMIDFALEAERKEGKAAARRRSSGVPAALPADHDDDDGGAARRRAAGARHRHRLGAAAAARHRDRRRADLQPAPHALHHAGDLPRLRPAGAAADGRRSAAATATMRVGGGAHEHLRARSSAARSPRRC